MYPPESLWTTVAATVTDPVAATPRWAGSAAWSLPACDLAVTRAAGRGDAGALTDLAWIGQGTGDSAGAEFVAVQGADRGNIIALNDVATLREHEYDPNDSNSIITGRPAAVISQISSLIEPIIVGEVGAAGRRPHDPGAPP